MVENKMIHINEVATAQEFTCAGMMFIYNLTAISFNTVKGCY